MAHKTCNKLPQVGSWSSPIVLLDDRARNVPDDQIRIFDSLEDWVVPDGRTGKHFDQLIMDDIITRE